MKLPELGKRNKIALSTQNIGFKERTKDQRDKGKPSVVSIPVTTHFLWLRKMKVELFPNFKETVKWNAENYLLVDISKQVRHVIYIFNLNCA